MLPAPTSPLKAGRPRALDEAKCREVVALVSAGCGIGDAAQYVGCAASTIRREGRRNPQFGDELRRAKINAELFPLQAIRQAAKKYWRAGAWLLERMNPQRFGKQNVRFLKPEQLEVYFEMLVDVIRKEARDPETMQRLMHRFEELARLADRETWAERDEPPRPRRRKRSPNS